MINCQRYLREKKQILLEEIENIEVDEGKGSPSTRELQRRREDSQAQTQRNRERSKSRKAVTSATPVTPATSTVATSALPSVMIDPEFGAHSLLPTKSSSPKKPRPPREDVLSADSAETVAPSTTPPLSPSSAPASSTSPTGTEEKPTPADGASEPKKGFFRRSTDKAKDYLDKRNAPPEMLDPVKILNSRDYGELVKNLHFQDGGAQLTNTINSIIRGYGLKVKTGMFSE
jgi:hypothetical protein